MSLEKEFRNASLSWMLEEIERRGFYWIVKRLTSNDTGLTGGHQAGVYLPKEFFKKIFPEICNTTIYNPDSFLKSCFFPSNGHVQNNVRAIYYNNKFFPERKLKKKYNEFRMTGWGGQKSPVQQEDNTGSIFILAIDIKSEKHGIAWVTQNSDEEILIEDWLREDVEPGRFYSKNREYASKYDKDKLPANWFREFPTGTEIFEYVTHLLPGNKWKKSVDDLLLKRREYEFSIFELIEQEFVLPKVENGFNSMDDFMKLAHSVANRRKSRAGKSLELNLERIFKDEGIMFETQVRTENNKKPDFIFPSSKAYRSVDFDFTRLRMLASKTCCKDRWRQILNEANRIKTKHLFTLQEGVSINQLNEMKSENVVLVVPKPNLLSFPKEKRDELLTLESFIGNLKDNQIKINNLNKWMF